MQDEQPPASPEATGEDNPDCGLTLPSSRAGMDGVVWAAWSTPGGPRTSPPAVVRAMDAADLRKQIRRAEGKMA